MTDLDQIKQKVDIVTLVSEYVQLKKAGVNFKGLCPFHNEKTPSFVVSPERGIWHCFGGCQDGGDIFKFLMRIENIDFAESLKILAQRAGVTLTNYQPTPQSKLKERIYAANLLASEYYNYILTKHPLGEKARDYLKNRKINPNSINLFKIGYSPNSWESLTKFLLKKGFTQNELESAGLVSRSQIGKIFDRFRGRVIFSLKDVRGNIVGFAGRLLDPDAKEAKYVNTAETEVYIKGNILYGLDTTKDEIKKLGFVVVVEGEIDAIQSYQAGIRNVVAIKGSALTSGHVTLLKRYTENIYLSLDSDFAGDAAAHRGIQTADQAGLNIKVVTFKEAKDPDELIKLDPSLWRQAVGKAVPFYDYIIDSAVAKHNPKEAAGAKEIIKEVSLFIGTIDNLVVKDHYLKRLGNLLNVGVDVVELQINKEIKNASIPIKPLEQKNTTKSRDLLLEEYLLSLLLQSKTPSDHLLLISARLSSADFINQTLGNIYQQLVNYGDRNYTIQRFSEYIPAELLEITDRLFLTEIPSIENITNEISKIAWEIKELSLRNRLKEISLAIKDSPEDPVLNSDFADTTNTLQELLAQRHLLEL